MRSISILDDDDGRDGQEAVSLAWPELGQTAATTTTTKGVPLCVQVADFAHDGALQGGTSRSVDSGQVSSL